MKKYLQFAFVVFCVLCVTSCGDSSDEEDIETELYKIEQENAFLAVGQEEGYEKWYSEANDGFVFAKQLVKGDGEQIYFNSWVSVYYKGTLTDGTVFDQREMLDGVPFKCAVSSSYASTTAGYYSVILGWPVALQNMVAGDKYEVWIPQQLGYGSSTSSSSIPSYSTLIFEIEVVSVEQRAVGS